MQKRNLFIVPLFFLLIALQAQDRVGCNQLLADAREAYSAGMVELVPELLLPCLESGLTGTAKQEAYKLVINAFLFDYQPEMADSLMNDFLDEYPTYQAKPSDPAEFGLLLRSHQQERVARAEPEEENGRETEKEDTPEGGTRKDQKPLRTDERPVRSDTNPAALGFTVGLNGNLPSVIEPYSMGVPLEDEGRFSIGGPGFQAGATADFPLGRITQLSIGLTYNRTRFNYSADPFEFTAYVVREYQSRIQLPVSLLFIVNPDSRTRVFLRAGIMTDYLLGASMSATRTYTETGGAILRDVVLEEQDISGTRSRMNFWGQGGAGVRVPFSAGFIFFETRFQPGFSKINREGERFSSGDLTWLIYHVDSDFRIHQLSLLAGISWDL